jgi:membrane protein required for colicin V production
VNQVDALLLVLLTPFALRGFWRGFCRESFGLAGLLGGALAAAAGSSRLAGVMLAAHLLPPIAALPVAFAAIFVGIGVVANLLGLVADRLVRAVLLGGVNRIAGVAFGTLKGAAALGFLLLVAERLASPAITEVITASRLGGPLMHVATGVLEAGRGLAAAAGHGHA